MPNVTKLLRQMIWLMIITVFYQTQAQGGDTSKSEHRVIELTDGNFEVLTKATSESESKSPWLLLFKGDRCPHCERIKPEFEFLSNDDDLQKLGFSFGRVDVPTNSLSSTRFSIRGFPTVLLLHEGRYYKYSGVRTSSAIKQDLIDHMKNFQKSNRELREEFGGSGEYGIPIPPPITYIQHLYISYEQVVQIAKLKAGFVGEISVKALFFLAVFMAMLSVALLFYLTYLILREKRLSKSNAEVKKIQ